MLCGVGSLSGFGVRVGASLGGTWRAFSVGTLDEENVVYDIPPPRPSLQFVRWIHHYSQQFSL